MNSIFLMHLIVTIVSCCFMIMMWRYNMKLININYDLMRDNLKIIEKLNDSETISESTKTYIRALKDNEITDTNDPKFKEDMREALKYLDEIEATIDKIKTKQKD